MKILTHKRKISEKRNIIITIIISLIFLALIAVFWRSYVRFGETCRDFGLSLAYYFCTLAGIKNGIVPTVTEYSSALQQDILLPSDFEKITSSVGSYFSLLADGENFSGYWTAVGNVLVNAVKWITLVLPMVILLVIVVWRMYKSQNTNHNRDTVPLRIFKLISKYTYQPVKRVVISYRRFLDENRNIRICWIVLWVFHLNGASIIMAFFAYYFYFVVSFDFSTIWVQLCKLFIDLQVLLNHFPWWSILAGAYVLFNRWRKKIALNRLRHCEARNCGFINELPIVSMSCGSMGKKKVRPEMA